MRDVTQKAVAENKEIMNIVKILGLRFGHKGELTDMFNTTAFVRR